MAHIRFNSRIKAKTIDVELGDSVTVGRNRKECINDIDVSDHLISVVANCISKYHMKIVQSGGRYMLLDLGSRNGTELNGERVIPYENTLLKDGDEIGLLTGSDIKFKVTFYE